MEPQKGAGESPSADHHDSPARTLLGLPSEILRLIVGHLLPPQVKRFQPGHKKDLQNANLAHPCLRQWVPEFMFRDMALTVVLSGMSPQLERLLAEPLGAKISKYIKNVQVQIPPAIRWEINCQRPDDLQENTMMKLRSQHFKVKQLTDDQAYFCQQYHDAMVEPFIDSGRWYRLLEHASATCFRVFPRLPKLEHIECGICLPKNHPAPTTTNTFMRRWKDEVASIDLRVPFVEDYDPNLAWISGVILHSMPPQVKSLRLWAANLANLHRFNMVNRLLSRTYRFYKLSTNPAKQPMAVKNLTLCVGGYPGTHGNATWAGDTGSIGLVKYWADVINGLPNLTHLAIIGEMDTYSPHDNLPPTPVSDHAWMTWLFGRLSVPHLESLALQKLEIHDRSWRDIFKFMPKSLKRLLVDGIFSYGFQGDAHWIEQMTWLVNYFPSLKATLNDDSWEKTGIRELCAANEKLGFDLTEDEYFSWRHEW